MPRRPARPCVVLPWRSAAFGRRGSEPRLPSPGICGVVRQISVRNNVSVSRTRQIPPRAGKGVPGHGCRRRTSGQLKKFGVEANSTDRGRHRSYGTQVGCCASEHAMLAAMSRKILSQCSFRSSAQTGSSRVGVSDVDPRTVPRLAVGGSGRYWPRRTSRGHRKYVCQLTKMT